MYVEMTKDSKESVENNFLTFFRMKEKTSVRDSVNGAINPVITNNDNEGPTFSMQTDKCLGPDGLNPDFYQLDKHHAHSKRRSATLNEGHP
jgi:hypothetical protein